MGQARCPGVTVSLDAACSAANPALLVEHDRGESSRPAVDAPCGVGSSTPLCPGELATKSYVFRFFENCSRVSLPIVHHYAVILYVDTFIVSHGPLCCSLDFCTATTSGPKYNAQ